MPMKDDAHMTSPYLTKPLRTEAEVRAIRNAAKHFVREHPEQAKAALKGNEEGWRSFAQGYFRGYFFSYMARL